MAKKYKQKQKNGKNKQDVNKSKKDKRNKKEKKIKKENTKKREEIKESEEKNEEEKKKKLLEKIYKVKYLNVCVGNEDYDGVEIFRENGEKIDSFDVEPPLYYGNFHFTVDADTGKILDWPNTKLYAKVYMRAIDTGSYDYYDKDDNKIYEEEGYVPDFFGITSPAYGDTIYFDTDANGFILDWKEKNIKEQIIKHLRKRLLGEDDFN